ncbi:putative reverse transcriptase domain-containing protein [Tanacetum coccineum]
MHTTMVPVQVKTQKIQAGVQVMTRSSAHWYGLTSTKFRCALDTRNLAKKVSMTKAFKTMPFISWGEVNPTHAYYNGSYTSKDTEDPSWSTSNDKKQCSLLEYKFQDKEYSEDIFSSGSALEDLICVVFVPDRNIMLIDKYCPRGEIKKLEIEIWNLKVKGTDVESYTQHFQELALMCRRMFLEESDQVEKFVGGLPDMIQGSVMASNPKTMQEAIEIANDPMDQKIYTLVERPGEKKPFGGSKPLCPNCNYHHDGQCAPKCANCKRTDHLTWDCRSQPAAAYNQRAQGANQRVLTCFEYGAQGHFKRTNPNSNVVTGTFLLNNRYASILFGTGADRSFVSTTFSSLIDIISTTLDHGYDVALAEGRIIWFNTLIQGCTLNFLNHPFNIDLMPVEMGSFDVIIGMNWLSKYHAVIVCDERIICIPFGNEILIVRGDRSNHEHGSRLNIISCTKTQKYLLKGCHVFLAHVTARKAEDKLEEKRLKDVPIV